jgi:hypothetical protein
VHTDFPLFQVPSSISAQGYTLNQLRYDIRVAALFAIFRKRICGPLASSLLHHRPTSTRKSKPPAKIEIAYKKADAAIQNLIDQLAA